MFAIFDAFRNPTTDVSLSNASSHDILVDPPNELMVNKCRCCGTLVKFPSSSLRYRCSVCRSVLTLTMEVPDGDVSTPVRLHDIQNMVFVAHQQMKLGMSTHRALRDIERYITDRFGSASSLNVSFIPQDYGSTDGKIAPINYAELHAALHLIAFSTGSKRPYLKLLKTVSELLREGFRTHYSVSGLRWILVLFELPGLKNCLYHQRQRDPRGAEDLELDCPELKAFCFEIITRLIGYLANSDSITLLSLNRWLSLLPLTKFEAVVQLINLFITFNLTIIINKQHNQTHQDNDLQPTTLSYSDYSASEKLNPYYVSSPSNQQTTTRYDIHLPTSINNRITEFTEWTRSLSSVEQTDDRIKLRVHSYGNNWHIRSAARLLSVLHSCNRNDVPIHSFYNILSDYIFLKQDFEVWQANFRNFPHESVHTRLYYDIINSGCISTADIQTTAPKFTFCQFPFLLTLGSKISILEYEARRYMERSAEDAFITSLDSRKSINLHLKIHVRRDHITNDSLRFFTTHKSDLKKVLKVEFIGEPGIDVGGLKKEWFHLLVKDLIRQDTGMFFYNDESNLSWFCPSPLDKNEELYKFIGIVLGLAMYNSTILDLKFPLALYKKLMGKKVTFDDYKELFPSTAGGLHTLLHTNDDIEDMCIYFDTTFKDLFGNTVVRELVPGGSSVIVTKKNRHDYVNKWIDFYMNTAIEEQFQWFYDGFHKVIGGNALSLFSPKEVELVICGSEEKRIDTESFKAITKYNGWYPLDIDPTNHRIVKWFWEWFSQLSYEQHKKFLVFVTGSDKVPVTGESSMTFKLTKLSSYSLYRNSKLPVAHTCFNELCLYDYKTKNELWSKLDLSINECEGFALR